MKTIEQIVNNAIADAIASRVFNGWVTLKKTDEEGNRIKVYIPGYVLVGDAVKNFQEKASKEFKGSIIYDFSSNTRADVSGETQNFIKRIINDTIAEYKITQPPLMGVNVCTVGGGAAGVTCTNSSSRIISLDSSIFKEKAVNAIKNSQEQGWLTKTDKIDPVQIVLMHELGHAISIRINKNTNSKDNQDFWNKIQEIKKEYTRNVKADDLKNPDYISKYARSNLDEFVAESYTQAKLLKKHSKYAKMVLSELDNVFKGTKQMNLFNSKNEEEFLWVEDGGIGFSISEEFREEKLKELDKVKKENSENNKE